MLQRLRKFAKWQPRGNRRSRGDMSPGAVSPTSSTSWFAPTSASLPMSRSNARPGKVRVTKFTVAHDCGQIINPDGVRNQIEGNVVQTVSRTLIEELQFDRSRVTSLDWASYPILTFPGRPDMVIELIDRPKEKPWGAGEPTAAVVPSAIANAVFDATACVCARCRSCRRRCSRR